MTELVLRVSLTPFPIQTTLLNPLVVFLGTRTIVTPEKYRVDRLVELALSCCSHYPSTTLNHFAKLWHCSPDSSPDVLESPSAGEDRQCSGLSVYFLTTTIMHVLWQVRHCLGGRGYGGGELP